MMRLKTTHGSSCDDGGDDGGSGGQDDDDGCQQASAKGFLLAGDMAWHRILLLEWVTDWPVVYQF